MTPQADINILAVQNLPIDQRLKKWILWAKGLVYPLFWRMGLFVQYQNGTMVSNYSGAVTYDIGGQVKFNYAVWESLVNGNTGNIPDASSDYWIKVNDSFIGISESSRYGGGKLNLEWALNRYFQTTFRQPDSDVSPTPSEIYITNTAPVYVSIAVGAASQELDTVSTVSGMTGIATDSIIGSATSYNFTVHIPAGVYAAINTDAAIAETIVRQFLDNYVVSGIQYIIVTY